METITLPYDIGDYVKVHNPITNLVTAEGTIEYYVYSDDGLSAIILLYDTEDNNEFEDSYSFQCIPAKINQIELMTSEEIKQFRDGHTPFDQYMN